MTRRSFELPWRRYLAIFSVMVVALYGILFWGDFLSLWQDGLGGSADAPAFGRDLRAFLGAGELAIERDGAAIYDPGQPVYVEADASWFVNPPWFAMLMMSIAWVPFSIAFPLWTLASVAVMWAVLSHSGLPASGRVTLATLVALPGGFAVFFGQSTYFIAAIILLAAVGLARKSGVRGAAAMALLAFKPHLFLGFGVWWLLEIRWRWRWIATASAVTVVLIAVSAWWLPGAWPAFGESISDPGSLVDPEREVTLVSAVRLLGGPAVVTWLGVAMAVGVSLFLLFVGLRRWPGNIEVGAALAIVASLLVAPHGLIYDWLMLVPAGVLLARSRIIPFGTLALIGGGLAAVVALGDTFSTWQIDSFERAVHIAPLALTGAFWWLVTWSNPSVSRREVEMERP